MRYIDNSKLVINDKRRWEARAKAAAGKVKAAKPANRATLIGSNSKIWTDLRPALRALSGDRCWYCETPEVRDYGAVDHFRPKNSVAGVPHHRGYWWLAFKAANYRYACTYCNTPGSARVLGTAGGKHDYFPLRAERYRCRSPKGDLTKEQPMLLDPTEPTDPGLLWFDDAGSAAPAPDLKLGSYAYKRASQSVSTYNLNQPNIKDRRLLKANEVKRLAVLCDRDWKRAQLGKDRNAEKSFQSNVRAMYGLRTGDYSATVICTLNSLKTVSGVVMAILQGR